MKKSAIIAGVVLSVLILMIHCDCTTSKVNHVSYYDGYIYTKDGQPVANLMVHPDMVAKSIGITDENGYFRFERLPPNFISSHLEVEFEGKIIDTIYITRRGGSHTHVSYHFCDLGSGRDTLFIDWTNEKEAKEQTGDSQQLHDMQSDIDSGNIDMVYVQGGTFMMGCTPEKGSDCWDREKPAHRVTVSSFYLGRYEVTQGLWMKVMDYNPSSCKGDNMPVNMVTWNGWNAVQTFIERLNEKTGKKYRLPTEAEWEYAARGGNKSKGYKYSGSNNIDDVAWYFDYGNSGKTIHPVGIKQPNELGIYDMSGNVSEWVNDWYGDYNSSEQTNPTGPSSGSIRVVRNGGYTSNVTFCRVSSRTGCHPHSRSFVIGFRLAHDAKLEVKK